MSYDDRLQANGELFDKIRFIPIDELHILRPTILEVFDEEAKLYLINSRHEGVKKYLPSVYVENEDQAKEKLLDFSKRMLLKASLFYCIRPKSPPFPLGYLHFNTPVTPTGLDSWTVDFWLGDKFQGKGLMVLALHKSLEYLKSYDVPEVKALVHPDNQKSIKVLERVGFHFVNQEPAGMKRLLYSIKLKN